MRRLLPLALACCAHVEAPPAQWPAQCAQLDPAAMLAQMQPSEVALEETWSDAGGLALAWRGRWADRDAAVARVHELDADDHVELWGDHGWIAEWQQGSTAYSLGIDPGSFRVTCSGPSTTRPWDLARSRDLIPPWVPRSIVRALGTLEITYVNCARQTLMVEVDPAARGAIEAALREAGFELETRGALLLGERGPLHASLEPAGARLIFGMRTP